MAMKQAERRRLTDLYVRGDFLELDDGAGDTIRVYIRKMPPTLHEKAVKRANAARSKTAAELRDESTDEHLDLMSELEDMDLEDLIEYLVQDQMMARAQVVEAEILSDSEWGEDNYLEGLRDSWVNGLDEAYAQDPEDPEASKVRGELERFADELDKILDGERETIEKDVSSKPPEKLVEMVAEKFTDTRKSMAWLTEFRMCEVWLSVYEEDKKTPYFTSREEVDMLEASTLIELQAKYREIAVDPLEGKD